MKARTKRASEMPPIIPMTRVMSRNQVDASSKYQPPRGMPVRTDDQAGEISSVMTASPATSPSSVVTVPLASS